MSKPWYYIKYKYPNEPFIEWARTQVPGILPHYEHQCKMEFPGAEVKTFKEIK